MEDPLFFFVFFALLIVCTLVSYIYSGGVQLVSTDWKSMVSGIVFHHIVHSSLVLHLCTSHLPSFFFYLRLYWLAGSIYILLLRCARYLDSIWSSGCGILVRLLTVFCLFFSSCFNLFLCLYSMLLFSNRRIVKNVSFFTQPYIPFFEYSIYSNT